MTALRIVPIMVTYSDWSDKPRRTTHQVCEGYSVVEGHRQLCVVADGFPGPQGHMSGVAHRIVSALTAREVQP